MRRDVAAAITSFLSVLLVVTAGCDDASEQEPRQEPAKVGDPGCAGDTCHPFHLSISMARKVMPSASPAIHVMATVV